MLGIEFNAILGKRGKMKAQELIDKLKPYADFDLEITVHLEVTEEELQKILYKYPHKDYRAELNIDDIGYSDNVVCIGIEITDEQNGSEEI